MRVLTVGNRPPDPSAGGLEVVWADLVAGLRAAGHEVGALHPPELAGYWDDGRWRRPGPAGAWSLDRRARRTLRERLGGADVVVWITLGGLPLSLLAEAERAGVPQIGLVHDAWLLYGPMQDRWHRFTRRAVPSPEGMVWCANSAFTAQSISQVLGDALVEVVRPGVDLGLFRPAPARDTWEGRLVSVGRLGQEKGLRHAVEALGQLPGATLTVHGPPHPDEEAELRRVAAAAGAGDRLVLAGPLSRADVPAAYAAADAVVFCVVWQEPWGLVPLEAMAVGRPVIATGTGGSAEYLRDGENCLLVPRFDGGAIAAAVAHLRDDPALRARLVEGGRATAQAHAQARFVARQIDVIVRTAGGAGVPGPLA